MLLQQTPWEGGEEGRKGGGKGPGRREEGRGGESRETEEEIDFLSFSPLSMYMTQVLATKLVKTWKLD